jgi:NitT/TauT family transport system substrate-binding protein
MKRIFILLLGATLLVTAAACGDDDSSTSSEPTTDSSTAAGPTDGSSGGEDVTVRLAYFPNITHAPALVGLQNGTFEEALGENVTLEPISFNSGTEEIEALFAGEVDIGFIGPNPAINGYVQSDGEALRIISGATSGGALLVVDPEAEIAEPGDFSGKKIASPSLGNTQDVALRVYLTDNDLAAQEQGGDVQVIPQDNPDTLTAFQTGQIDGAWVPEPWATRLVQEGGGEVFLDEKELWPNGEFVTTHMIVATEFLEEHPDVVADFLRGHVETVQLIQTNPEEAKTAANAQIEADTTAPLPAEVIDAAWENLTFTFDPIASSLRQSASDAFDLGFLEEEPDLVGIYELGQLNTVLQEAGLPPVSE